MSIIKIQQPEFVKKLTTVKSNFSHWWFRHQRELIFMMDIINIDSSLSRCYTKIEL